MEASFNDELKLLANALSQETFRFILIGHNRYSLYKDIADGLHIKFPKRSFLELRLDGKDYRQITDAILGFQKGIILIPDFDWLFREGNEEVCVAFNQRRDAFARLDIAMICFIEPSGFIKVPKKVPDWWSLRSLELDFYRESSDTGGEFLNAGSEITSLDGQLQEEKEANIQRLRNQIERTEPTNKSLLLLLYSQIARLWFDLSYINEAKEYWEKCLELSREIGDRKEEGIALNYLGLIYKANGDYVRALEYYNQSLAITREIEDKGGEVKTLNNISLVYHAEEKFDLASIYFEKSLQMAHQIGDLELINSLLINKKNLLYIQGKNNINVKELEQMLPSLSGESRAIQLSNIGQMYSQQGEYNTALKYFKDSLIMANVFGYKRVEALALNNISQVYMSQDEIDFALDYLIKGLEIARQIGNKSMEGTILHNIGRVYEAKSQYDIALNYLNDSLNVKTVSNDKQGEAETLYVLGRLHSEQFQNAEKAISLLVKAQRIFKQIGSSTIKSVENKLNAIRQQIGEERFNQILQSIQNNPTA